jgi:hypothetical protein
MRNSGAQNQNGIKPMNFRLRLAINSETPSTSKAAEHSRTPKRWRALLEPIPFRKVLECGCALPLFPPLRPARPLE